jgi:hypothetical protein
MNKHKCSRCNTNFKYLSYLKRHIENKKQCTITTNTINENINEPNLISNKNIDDINIESLIPDSINIKKDSHINNYINLLTDIMKDLIKDRNHIETIDKINKLQTLVIKNTIIDNNYSIDNTSLDNKEILNKSIKICKECDNKFTTKQALYNHIKLKRCKGKKDIQILQKQINYQVQPQQCGFTFDDIINSNNDYSHDNTITNTSNSNNNIINNIAITINAFGCETLDHITTKDFISLFKHKNIDLILFNLSTLIYIKNTNNQNFTKQNLNKKIVTYLDRDMEIKQLTEKTFLAEFEENIKKLCIELFYIHKNNLSIEDLIEYMRMYLLYIQKVKDNKTTHAELVDHINTITDNVFRSEEIKSLISKVLKELLFDKDLKKLCLTRNINRIDNQKKGLDEFKYKPKDEDERNINKVKTIAMKKNFECENLTYDINTHSVKVNTEITNNNNNNNNNESNTNTQNITNPIINDNVNINTDNANNIANENIDDIDNNIFNYDSDGCVIGIRDDRI